MKIILALLLSCTILYSENIAEIKKHAAALAAENEILKAHVKSLQANQKKLTDAVGSQAETSAKIGDKIGARIEAATDKIIESEATGKKLVETVESQAAASQDATAQLTDEVKLTGFAVKSAISAQARREQIAIVEAKKIARELEKSKADATETKRQYDVRLDDANRQLEKILQQREVAAALDQRGTEHDKYAFWSVVMPIVGTIILSLGGAIVGFLINKRLGKTEAQNTQNAVTLTNIATKQGETHELVNGRYTKLEAENEALRAKLAERNT